MARRLTSPSGKITDSSPSSKIASSLGLTVFSTTFHRKTPFSMPRRESSVSPPWLDFSRREETKSGTSANNAQLGVSASSIDGGARDEQWKLTTHARQSSG